VTDQEQSQELTLDTEPEEPLRLVLPETARIPEGATFWEGADDGYCRVVKADGSRCQGIRMKAYGLCAGHAGTSRIYEDPRAMQKKGAVAKVRARERRSLLVSTGMNPRRAAREVAIRRSDAVVRALVDDPLDDETLSTVARQRAVIGMLDAVFPLATVSAEIELPADAEGVEQLGWSDMQRLASRLMPELEPGVAEG
jgi:hypothetical protein